jgi:hypothetical protein
MDQAGRTSRRRPRAGRRPGNRRRRRGQRLPLLRASAVTKRSRGHPAAPGHVPRPVREAPHSTRAGPDADHLTPPQARRPTRITQPRKPRHDGSARRRHPATTPARARPARRGQPPSRPALMHCPSPIRRAHARPFSFCDHLKEIQMHMPCHTPPHTPVPTDRRALVDPNQRRAASPSHDLESHLDERRHNDRQDHRHLRSFRSGGGHQGSRYATTSGAPRQGATGRSR